MDETPESPLRIPLMVVLLAIVGGQPREMGLLEAPRSASANKPMQGSLCSECGNHTVIKKDGCDFCTACGWVGTCG